MKYLLACSCKLRNIFFDGCQPTAQQHRHLSRTQPRMKAPLPPLSTASILSRCCFLFVWVMQQRISANLLCRYMFGEHIAILFFFFFLHSVYRYTCSDFLHLQWRMLDVHGPEAGEAFGGRGFWFCGVGTPVKVHSWQHLRCSSALDVMGCCVSPSALVLWRQCGQCTRSERVASENGHRTLKILGTLHVMPFHHSSYVAVMCVLVKKMC